MTQDWPRHGYSVRNVKCFRGMEGEGFNATFYRDGRRIAFVIDDASGGEIHIQWTDPHTRDAEEIRFLEFLKALPKERSRGVEYSVSPDMFIAVLVEEASNERGTPSCLWTSIHRRHEWPRRKPKLALRPWQDVLSKRSPVGLCVLRPAGKSDSDMFAAGLSRKCACAQQEGCC